MTKATRRGVGLACALTALASAVLCTPAAGQVKTRILSDGTVEIYNDGPGGTYSSRGARLRAVPKPEWGDWIRDHAATHGVDARLVQAIVQVESGYNARAVSRKGAVGLMQLMPATARDLKVANRYNAEQNIRGGVAYLRQMIDLFPGRLELAIAAYNAGPSAVQRHGGVPPYAETREYVDRVLTLYRGGSSVLIGISGGGGGARLNGLDQGGPPSPLQQALASGLVRPAGVRAVSTATQPTLAAVAPRPRVVPAALAAVAEPSQASPAEASAAATAPPAPPAVVPASLPVPAEPVAAQAASGG